MFGLADSEVIVLRHESSAAGDADLFRTVLADPILARLAVSGILAHSVCVNATCVIDQRYRADSALSPPGDALYFRDTVDLRCIASSCRTYGFVVVADARFIADVDASVLRSSVLACRADAAAIYFDAALAPGRDHLALTAEGSPAGIRRIYGQCIRPHRLTDDWPALLYIKPHILAAVDYRLPADFSEFIDRLGTHSIAAFRAGARVRDLRVSGDMLNVLLASLSFARRDMAATVRHDGMFGDVIVSPDARVSADAVLVGPAVLCAGVRVGPATAVIRTVLARDCVLPVGAFAADEFIISPTRRNAGAGNRRSYSGEKFPNHEFQHWNFWTYHGLYKRLADIVAATSILLVFLPVIVLIAAMIRLSSRGPAFYGDKRQGLHGRQFRCWKFRSMITGADRLQQKLRKLNEVDGPQFKMQNDPRVTTLGRFLRATYLDELPQFFNVLTGTMSIVGPRPSPQAENSLCPAWRDARLSVRPGITGLWQVCRTRKIGADFQEWVHYDRLYVSQISPGLDMWICFKTAMYIGKAFLKQF